MRSLDIIVLDRPVNHLNKSLSHIRMTFDLTFSCLCLIDQKSWHFQARFPHPKAGFLCTVIRFLSAGEGLVSDE